jgi:hypothetical protein
MLEWLATGANAKSYLCGTKTTACKELAQFLEEQQVSEVTRTWKAIKNRLAALFKKYKDAIRAKNSTGWGTVVGEGTVAGLPFNKLLYMFSILYLRS